MGARTGAEYLAGLHDGRDVWLGGAKVDDVATDHRLAGMARTLAALYDRQHRHDVRDRTLFRSTTSGAPVGMAFLQPRDAGDLARRREGYRVWAEFSGGMLGRSPDFMATLVAALAAASDLFATRDRAFANNVARFYDHCRENDVCLTHALSRPVREQNAPIRIVREDSDGIIVSGSRTLATLAPFADEIVILPGPAPRNPEEAEHADEFAVGFAAPLSAEGLRLLCRDALSIDRSPCDHPLGARFDEQDALVLFDSVRVPWSRVFLHRDVELANTLWSDSHALSQVAHQFLVKNWTKAEFILGLTGLVAEETGAVRHAHVQSMLGECVDAVETLRALIRAAEADAIRGPSDTVVPSPDVVDTARNYFPNVYPRLIEILQIVGASGHICHVPEATAGELPDLVDKHYATHTLSGRERNRLFKLAWDAACSGFAGRQVLYERYFDGDPFRKRAARYTRYAGRESALRRVRDFLRDARNGVDEVRRQQDGRTVQSDVAVAAAL